MLKLFHVEPPKAPKMSEKKARPIFEPGSNGPHSLRRCNECGLCFVRLETSNNGYGSQTEVPWLALQTVPFGQWQVHSPPEQVLFLSPV